MAQRLLENDDVWLDTPFLQRIRAAGHTAGDKIGALAGRRRSILDLLVLRFDPPVSVYQQIERRLATVTDEEQLRRLLEAMVQAESVAAVQTVLFDMTSKQSKAYLWPGILQHASMTANGSCTSTVCHRREHEPCVQHLAYGGPSLYASGSYAGAWQS